MSTWNLGIDDVSEETRAFKDKIFSKDGQIAAQQDRLIKQAADLEEMKERLNEALHKLTAESQRALKLEADLSQRLEDLKTEKIGSENANTALISAQEKVKSSHLELRQLEGTLERVSHTSDEHKAHGTKMEREKSMLEARVRELESNLREMTQPTSTPTPGRRVLSRPRSSSLSNFRITTLEQDLLEVRGSLEKTETELQSVSQKLGQVSKDLIKAENDKSATEKQLNTQITALKASLEEKEEELVYLRQQQGDGSREDELLKRIEEDDAKIAALGLMLREEEGTRELKERNRRIENKLKEEQRRVAEGQEYCTQLVKEKHEALDQLKETRRDAQSLAEELQKMKLREHTLKEKATKSLETCDDSIMNDDSCLIDMDTMDPVAPLATDPPPRQETDIDTITQIERLLGAIDRLRGERDALRRDVQFLETESRFTIEALEAKLSASISTVSSPHTLATIDQLRSEMDELHAQLLAANSTNANMIHEKNLEIKRLGLQVQALAVALGRATSPADATGVDASEKRQSDLHAVRTDIKDLADKHDETVRSLEDVTSQHDGLLMELQNKDSDWERELEAFRMAEQDAMHEIAELNNHIDAIESERDSLTLQVTNLIADLQIAQEELTNAESRYTNLQFHQLSNMTSNEATRTLRDHIEELEGRVMRRNELVGILQHDVRRLDTNLRLQEERLIEMTSELEMMAAQKDAMVEDCADAREARNEALLHIEALEIDLENMEGKKAALEEQKAALEGQTVILKEKQTILESQKVDLEGQNAESGALISELISVLAGSVNHTRETIRRARDYATTSKSDIFSSQQSEPDQLQQLQAKIFSLVEIPKQLDARRDMLQRISTSLEQCQLETKQLFSLAQSLQMAETDPMTPSATLNVESNKATVMEQQSKDQEGPSYMHGVENIGAKDVDIEESLAQLRIQHTEDLGTLQKQLIETEGALQELRTRYIASEGDYQRAQEEAQKSILELQEQLSTATKKLSDIQQLREELDNLHIDKEKGLAELRDQLNVVEQREKEAIALRDSLQAENDRLIANIDRLQQEQDTLLGTQSNKLAFQQDLERKVHSLQGRFEEETRLLEISKEEAARLELRLQKEVSGRAQDIQAHTLALTSAKEQCAQAHNTIAALQGQLNGLQEELQQAQATLAASEDEKTALQQEITTLEAENQKSKSLCRYLESQVKGSDHLVSTLKGDIDRLQFDLTRSEKACKAAEVNLSLQNAQHKRETAEFQREMSTLRSRPNLEHALSELEERNTEMEELLRAKCTEIEENDDRVLEMLKEKKKLSAKVETLNRKVQNLQAKLAAAKASNDVPTLPEPKVQSTPPLASRASTSSAQTPQSVHVPVSRPRSATVTATPSSMRSPTEIPSDITRKTPSRATSGPSSLPRPKTPERNRAVTPVFKARTPERRVVPEPDPLQSAVVIGKKRAAPDDFEACENIPAQAFTADGEDVENRTPRVRRVLNSLQSGFTPVRHQRPTVPMPSPRRAPPTRASPTFIADLTNTPYIQPLPTSAKPSGSKRSWLGKIRGSSQDKPSGVRSIFDRGEAP